MADKFSYGFESGERKTFEFLPEAFFFPDKKESKNQVTV
jgi:hypothetical protein